MNQQDIAGLLQTYAEKIAKSRTKEQVKRHIRDLRKELDLRKIEAEGE